MSRKVYDIEQLKLEYVGKSINWITVLDVFRNDNNRIVCLYKCKCGTEKTVLFKYIKSGSIKSCGCYRHSKEFANNISEWCKNNPDKIKARSDKYIKWLNNNYDKFQESNKSRSETMKSNTDLMASYKNRMSNLNKTANIDRANSRRIDAIKTIINNNASLTEIISPDDLQNLLLGKLKSFDKINIKCPLCNKYFPHNVRDIFNLSKRIFKQTRLCKSCSAMFSTSKYEQEIADFISTFYNISPIRNNRNIIYPLELDLYYPDKRIAIEFNGDYWHSEVFKDNLYHYNKLKSAVYNGITLVTIFESEWNNKKDSIKSYIRDLFSGIENELSYVDNLYINNNYPPPYITADKLNYIEKSYLFNDKSVFTCGLSMK